MKTGWPPGLLQDDDRKLSRWLASRPDAKYQLRKNIMKEDIIKMAREAGWHDKLLSVSFTMPLLERFAEIVEDAKDKRMFDEGFVTVGHMRERIAAEREACAKVCDELHWPWHMGDNSGPKECAAAIRARGEA